MSTATESPLEIDRLFHALSDEKRIRIIEFLGAGECCVCDLASALGLGQSLLSFHLRTLKEAGVVKDRRDGRWVHYTLDPTALERLKAFLGRVERSARRGGGACCRHG